MSSDTELSRVKDDIHEIRRDVKSINEILVKLAAAEERILTLFNKLDSVSKGHDELSKRVWDLEQKQHKSELIESKLVNLHDSVENMRDYVEKQIKPILPNINNIFVVAKVAVGVIVTTAVAGIIALLKGVA